MKNKFVLYLFASLLGLNQTNIISHDLAFLGYYPEPAIKSKKWDWNSIDLEKELAEFKVPADFRWGASTAEYQISGADNLPNSQWAHHEKKNVGKKGYEFLESSGIACDSLHRRDEDIDCIKQLGLNSYRFSVDWSLIEPKPGEINYHELYRYRDFCDQLIQEGIKPGVALYHQVHPQWFAELGGFEKEENIKYIVDFCKLVFTTIGSRVDLWTIAAEPSTPIIQGYLRGRTAPGEFLQFKKGAQALKNLLYTQVKVYEALKALPGGKEAKIGLAHNVMQVKPYYCFNPVSQITAYGLDQLLNKIVSKFFLSGIYEFNFPGVYLKSFCPEAPKSFDFFGLDYYSGILLGTTGVAYKPDDIRTDFDYAFYPQGLYYAIQEVSAFKVPIYILENGIADAKDDRRALWINRHMFALKKALADGYDVRGFFYWTLMDNYEWDEGYRMKFGLFEVDPVTKKRTLRNGSKAYQEIVRNSQR